MKHKSIVENVAKIIFTVCAVVAIFAVLSITIYMFLKGAPAFFKVGVLNLLFGTKWAPTAADPSYGILYIILTSIIGTAVSILIGVPIPLTNTYMMIPASSTTDNAAHKYMKKYTTSSPILRRFPFILVIFHSSFLFEFHKGEVDYHDKHKKHKTY